MNKSCIDNIQLVAHCKSVKRCKVLNCVFKLYTSVPVKTATAPVVCFDKSIVDFIIEPKGGSK